MALRLNDLVVCGELIATGHYSVQGWLGLRGADRPISLRLTGNPDPDLIGRHIRFEARTRPMSDEAPTDEIDLSNVAWQQIGPTGVMTAARMVRVSDCPPAEMYRRAKLGEMPPTEWKPCLYLEWYGQNGRVVIELVDPLIEDLAPQPERREVNASDFTSGDDDSETPVEPGLGITAISIDDDGNVEMQDLSPDAEQDESLSEDDPYNLFGDDLQRELDAQAWQIDRHIENDEDKPRDVREMELLDDLIEHSDGEPIISLFDGPVKLPRPDDLDDAGAEQALKVLLGQLAIFGIALDICKHFTPRDAYRLLLEEICVEERAYPELRDTQWVQHFMTSEYCDECDAEMEEEFRKYEDGRPDEAADDDLGLRDDDIPF